VKVRHSGHLIEHLAVFVVLFYDSSLFDLHIALLYVRIYCHCTELEMMNGTNDDNRQGTNHYPVVIELGIIDWYSTVSSLICGSNEPTSMRIIIILIIIITVAVCCEGYNNCSHCS